MARKSVAEYKRIQRAKLRAKNRCIDCKEVHERGTCRCERCQVIHNKAQHKRRAQQRRERRNEDR